MTSASSRVISAFDGLVEHMQSIELPPFDTLHVTETVLPALKTLLQQYADQHSRTKKDIASLRSAWTCLATYIPSQSIPESSGSAGLPPISSMPDAALDAVFGVASDNSELENSRQLIEQLQKQLQDLTTQYEAQNEDVCTENERQRLQTSELEALLLVSPPNPSSSHAVFAKCSAGIVSCKNRRDEQYLRDVFNRHKNAQGGLSTATLAQALIDADAPLVPDSEADAAASISRFNAYCNGLMDFVEFVRAVNAPDELALFFQEKQLPVLADALRAFVGRGQDQLLKVSQLSAEEMQAAVSAVCSHIPHQAKSIVEELQRSFAAQQRVQNDQPTLAQFARATSDDAQRKDEAFMRQVFNRHATSEKLSASTLIAALNDVAAPLLAATSSESSSDFADFIFRRADANMSGDIDFPE